MHQVHGVVGHFGNPNNFICLRPLHLKVYPSSQELIPIVVTAALFGHEWRDLRLMVEFKVDNLAVVRTCPQQYMYL